MEIAQEAYSGAADFGRFSAAVGFVFGTIISIFLLVVGIALLAQHVEPTQSIKGVVVDDVKNKCDLSHDESTKTNYYNCDVLVEYKFPDGKILRRRFIVTNQISALVTGQMINLYYKQSNPDSISSNSQINTHIVGAILLVVGLFVFALSWFHFYVTRKYKFAAAGSGVAQVAGYFRH